MTPVDPRRRAPRGRARGARGGRSAHRRRLPRRPRRPRRPLARGPGPAGGHAGRDGRGPGQPARGPGRGGHRQPRHGHLRAGRHPPHGQRAEALRGRAGHRRASPPSSRAWTGASARPSPPSGRRWPSSGPPTSRCRGIAASPRWPTPAPPGRPARPGAARRPSSTTPASWPPSCPRTATFRYLNPAGRRLLGLPADAAAAGRIGLRPRGRGRPSGARGRPASRPRARRRLVGQPQRARPIGGRAADPLDAAGLARRRRRTRCVTWVARDISTERAVYERLHKKVFEDDLTGLPHRSIFLDRLDLSLRRTHPGAPERHPAVHRLDRFRERNDRLAPAARDELLRGVADRLDALRRPADSVARWGDDEFLYLFEEPDDPSDQPDGAERVAAAFGDPFQAGGTDVFLTASIGVATGRPGAVTTDQLLRQADAASQMARQRGGGARPPLRRRDAGPGPAPGRGGGRPPGRGRPRRAGAPLPARGVAAHQPDRRRRGPRALAAPRLGARVARRVRARWRSPPT